MSAPGQNGAAATQGTPPLERVNVMLSREVLGWLDREAENLRRETGANVSRSELLRGIVGGLADGGAHIHGLKNEQEIRAALSRTLARLAKGPSR